MTLPVLCFFLSFSLFSFRLISFCSFKASVLLLFLFCHFFCYLLSCLLYATPVLTIDLLIFLLYFSFFLYLFIYYYYYCFLSSLFCLYSFTNSAHWLGVLSLILYTVFAVWHCSACSVVSSFWLHMGHLLSSFSPG